MRNHYITFTFHKLVTIWNLKELSKTQRRYAKAKRDYRFGAALSNIFACAASIVNGNNQKIYFKKITVFKLTVKIKYFKWNKI